MAQQPPMTLPYAGGHHAFGGGGFGRGSSSSTEFNAIGGAFGFSSGAGSPLSYLAQPPSFSAVADPNNVVILKNVLKKDGTTKAKGLEDLLAYVQAHPSDGADGVDEAVLEIWSLLYPRLSIDNSRRVRELSHLVLSELLKSARKRMARFIPRFVGAWLAGLYDRDRVVVKAVSDGIAAFLNSPQKVAMFWNKCQAQILDFAIDAIRETQDTLSDERSTSKEDAEAKYYRVVTCSLSIVLGLLQRNDDQAMQPFMPKYETFFQEEAVWKSFTLPDSSVRKAVCQLLFATLDRKLPYAESKQAKQAIITGGLKTSQSGSALEYVRALTKLTQADPTIWSTFGKPPADSKSPFSRLRAFIAKGSQGSPAKFWEYLDQLLSLLPEEVCTPELTSQLLTSLKAGITNREEPRTNTSQAWQCYVDTAKRLLKTLPPEDQLPFVQQHFFSLTEQFLFSEPDRPAPIPLGPNAMAVLVDIYVTTVQSAPPVVSASRDEWDRLAGILNARISASLPEAAAEFHKSQEKIGEEGRRWFSLVGQIQAKIDKPLDHTFSPSSRLVAQCMSLLKARNLKPFGAAMCLEFALSNAPKLFLSARSNDISRFLISCAEENFNLTLNSPSSRNLVSCIHLLGTIPGNDDVYAATWSTWASSIRASPPQHLRDSILAALLSRESASELAHADHLLQTLCIIHAYSLANGDNDCWELLEAVIKYKSLTKENYRKLLTLLLQGCKKRVRQDGRDVKVLDIVLKGDPEMVVQDIEIFTLIVACMLRFTELGHPELAAQCKAVISFISSQPGADLLSPCLALLKRDINEVQVGALSIETLVEQAETAAKTGIKDLSQLFPDLDIWLTELEPFIELPINPAVSITNSLGGALALVQRETRFEKLQSPRPRDSMGRAIPLRMALYTGQLLKKIDVTPLRQANKLEPILHLQYLTVKLASDQFSCLDKCRLWKNLSNHLDLFHEAETLINKTHEDMNKLVTDNKGLDESSIVYKLMKILRANSGELTHRAFYTARVLADFVQALSEAQGLPSQIEQKFAKQDLIPVTSYTALPAVAWIVGLGETLRSAQSLKNFCNRLVSDIAEAKQNGERTLKVLVLMSTCSQAYEVGELPVAKNRIVFAVRNICSWLSNPTQISPALSAEVCRVLNTLLPCMKDVYGSYWETTTNFCIALWKKTKKLPLDVALPYIHASLRLAKTLESLQDSNDELYDAVADFMNQKPRVVLDLLKMPRPSPSQALQIVDGMLCREVDKIPVHAIQDQSDIYGLLASDSREIQTAAFSLLHRAIPERQELDLVDMLIDEKPAQLPDELLSLLLDAPTLEKYPDEKLEIFPQPIRAYLLSWRLVFDAFSTPAMRFRNDFMETLKTGEYLGPLLDFTFDVLGHSAAKPLNLDKGDLVSVIDDYDFELAEAELDEKNMQWLLVNLYYLTLKYIPGLFRKWYMDCKSKQTRIAVESWTTKYFSPLIINDTLTEVQRWAELQAAPAADEQELVVRVSRAAKEITASYEVDEDQASISIRIPPSYPIDNVTVAGVHRVAVSEKKWQSWIMTTQGVITFSNGNITDGLNVFRRNIVGALKGQNECAICYSIISSDKRMPDKRCTTCKNMFHRACLYRWFQSSNQNTCPLCRNPIDYLGSDTAKRRQVRD